MAYARSGLVILFVFVGALLAITANATVWANRTVFDTDNFVDTTNRVLDEEDVQEQLAVRLSTTLIEQGEVEDRLRERLPEDLKFLAPPLTSAAQDVAYNAVLRALNNDALRASLDASLRLVHEQMLKILEDEGSIVIADGKVILDLRVILENAAERLNLEPNVDIELPEDAGQIVLVEDAQTAGAIQQLLSLHDTITWLVIGGAVAFFAVAVLISRNRRVTLRNVGFVLVACGLLSGITLLGLRPVAASFADNGTAARAAFDAFFLDYRIQSLFLVVLGAGVILVAALLGQSELAVAVRRTVRRPAGEAAPDLAGAVRASATPLRLFGLVLGALVLVAWPEPSDRVYVTTLLLLALYLTGLWIITSTSELAARARGQLAAAWDRVDGTSESERNATLVGRHAGQLRIAGIVLAIVVAFAIPNFGIGALAGIVAVTVVYLALIDWASAREA